MGNILATYSKWVEPWYFTYTLLGAAVAGIAPILLPLAVSRSGNVVAVGIVMAAFNLGGLAAPLWGEVADRYRLHHRLMVGGVAATALAFAVFPFTNTLAIWVVLALMQGAGAAAVATIANLFIVEVHPQSEWDERIGWLQTFYGAGQVSGLLLAGLLSQAGLALGLLTAAGLTVLGLLPGQLVPISTNPLTLRPSLPQPARHAHWAAGSPQHFYHRPTFKSLRQMAHSVNTPFARFLIAWFFSFLGSTAFFSFYPVLMQQVYGVGPALSSAGFAIVAAVGLVLYAPSGRWAERLGSLRILQIGLGMRGLAFLSLFTIGIGQFPDQGVLALLGFGFVVLAWSLLSVAGTALAAQLSPMGEGNGIGIFNASNALAGVLGASGGGWLASQWGYDALAAFGIVGIAVGLVMSIAIRKPRGGKEDS